MDEYFIERFFVVYYQIGTVCKPKIFLYFSKFLCLNDKTPTQLVVVSTTSLSWGKEYKMPRELVAVKFCLCHS